MGSTRKDTFTQIAFSVVFLLAFLAAFKLRIKHLFQTLICRISLKMHFQLRFTHVVTAFNTKIRLHLHNAFSEAF